MRKKRGYVLLESYVGTEKLDYIPVGFRIAGTPYGVFAEKRWAVHELHQLLKTRDQGIVWIDKFNGRYPAYHTVYRWQDGEDNYYIWFIYGG